MPEEPLGKRGITVTHESLMACVGSSGAKSNSAATT
jgi:hypothetical protein